MRFILIAGFFGFFATNSIAFDLKGAIDAIKTKAASGQNVQADIDALTNEVKKNSQSLVVTHKVDFSIVDNDGNVSLFVPGKPNTVVVSNSPQHEANAANAINKHPQAQAAHNPDGAATLGGGTSKPKSTTSTTSTASSSSSDSSAFGNLLSSILGAVTSIGGNVVTGAISGVAEGFL